MNNQQPIFEKVNEKMKKVWNKVTAPAKFAEAETMPENNTAGPKDFDMGKTQQDSVESSTPHGELGVANQDVLSLSFQQRALLGMAPVEPQDLLLFTTIEKGKVARSENYITHIQLGGEYESQLLFLTSERLLIVTATGKIAWQKKWKAVKGMPKLHLRDFASCDQLFIHYAKSKTVFHLQWIKRLSFTRKKLAKILPVSKNQEQFVKFFMDKD